MYIETAGPHSVSTMIDVRLSLPGGHEVDLPAHVVHVMTTEQAKLKRMVPGIGVEFVGLDGPRATALEQLLMYARYVQEGDADAPRYSFAQWLSKTAEPQTPSTLMSSLPPPPGASPLPKRSQPPAQRRTGNRRRTDLTEPRLARSETATSTVRMRQVTPRDAPASDAPSSVPAAPQPARATSSAPAPASGLRPDSTRPLHPTRNSDDLKLGMTHLAHRRYKEADHVFEGMLAGDAQDRDAQLWSRICHARQASAEDRLEDAIAHYRKVLVVEQHNREAELKIKTLQRNLRLKSIPFGRFFSKK